MKEGLKPVALFGLTADNVIEHLWDDFDPDWRVLLFACLMVSVQLPVFASSTIDKADKL